MTSTAKRTKRTRPPARPEQPGAFNMVLAVLTVFVLVIGGLGVMNQRAEHLAKAKPIPLRNEIIQSQLSSDLNSELFFLATEALSKTSEVNLAAANIIFKASVNDLLEQRYDPRRFGDDRVTPLGSDLSISIMPMNVATTGCTGYLDYSGTYASQTVPAYYRLFGYVYLDMNSSTEHLTSFTITVDEILPDITPFLETKLTEFEANGQSEYTDIGRMVRYMLTTLVRFRASEGIGSGPYDTEKDLLNEGDVELAVNLAVILEEASLFGVYDMDAVRAVDHYFAYAQDPSQHVGEVSWDPNNPTGNRPWGSAEQKNYARYENHMPAGLSPTLENLLPDLVNNYYETRFIDPADILALYLNLQNYQQGWYIDPYDDNTILDEKFLLDGRNTSDLRDDSHLAYFSHNAPPVLDLMDPTGTFKKDYQERFAVDQSPDYLLVGSDLSVTNNITQPWKWMTNARISEGSRTGGVPPPPPPPDHDWIMMWDFSIFGNFSLAVGRAPEASQSDGSSKEWLVNRTISLDIPINIFSSLKYRPTNSLMVFTNLNVGSPAGATYNFTLESLAYEQFANTTFSVLKDIYGIALGETLRLVKASTCPYPSALASGSDITVSTAAQELQNISQDVWNSVDDFVSMRLTGADLSTKILRPLLVSEYFMRMDYIPGNGTGGIKYTLRLTVDTNVGPIVIDLMMGEGNKGMTGRVAVGAHIKVDKLLDVHYNLTWDPSYQNLRPIGSGTMDGTLSIVREVQGRTLQKALDIPVGRNGLILRVLQDHNINGPDMTSEMASALPATLMGDISDQIVQAAKALRSVHAPSMTLLIGENYSGPYSVYAGLSANNSADVGRMLDWVVNNSVLIANFQAEGMLDMSALGTAAAQDLARYPGIEATFMSSSTIVDVPLMYYVQAAQMFTIQAHYAPLHETDLKGLTITGTSVPGTGRILQTLEYTVFSETLLSDPEVNYE